MLLMMWTTPAALYASAVLIGLSVGITTPLAYAHLAATTPSNRLGRTMGSAELGRELGDAGGPLLVGAIAASAGVTGGAAALALVATAAAASTALGLKRSGSAEPNVA
jgi:MFS family permease